MPTLFSISNIALSIALLATCEARGNLRKLQDTDILPAHTINGAPLNLAKDKALMKSLEEFISGSGDGYEDDGDADVDDSIGDGYEDDGDEDDGDADVDDSIVDGYEDDGDEDDDEPSGDGYEDDGDEDGDDDSDEDGDDSSGDGYYSDEDGDDSNGDGDDNEADNDENHDELPVTDPEDSER